MSRVAEDLTSSSWSKGALQLEVDTPLPKRLVEELLGKRMEQLR